MPDSEACVSMGGRGPCRSGSFRGWNSGSRCCGRMRRVRFTVSELSERFGISRETFYVWKRRRAAGLERWYEDLSHAPVHCRHGVAEDVVEAIVTLRHRFPRFGPKKLLAVLRMEAPQMAWPAASTIGEVLKRRGLIEPRRRRRLRQGSAVFGSDRPNQESAMDFKGWFRTGDGVRCDPLTVSDTASRYLIAVRIVPPSHEGVRSALEPVFSGDRPARCDALRQRHAVRLFGARWAVAAFGMAA